MEMDHACTAVVMQDHEPAGLQLRLTLEMLFQGPLQQRVLSTTQQLLATLYKRFHSPCERYCLEELDTLCECLCNIHSILYLKNLSRLTSKTKFKCCYQMDFKDRVLFFLCGQHFCFQHPFEPKVAQIHKLKLKNRKENKQKGTEQKLKTFRKYQSNCVAFPCIHFCSRY